MLLEGSLSFSKILATSLSLSQMISVHALTSDFFKKGFIKKVANLLTNYAKNSQEELCIDI